MRASLSEVAGKLSTSNTTLLFERPFANVRDQVFGSYAVFPDGKRFLTAERTAEVSTVLRVALGALRSETKDQ